MKSDSNLRMVKCAQEKSKEAAACKFRVGAQSIREWCQQKERLTALKKHGKARRKRLEGTGRKADNEDLEEAVFEWIIDTFKSLLVLCTFLLEPI